jgi:hypothetical protein
MSWSSSRAARATAAAAVAAAGMLALAGPAAAGSCHGWSGATPPFPAGASAELDAVTVISACDAWAVGGDRTGSGQRDLLLHWNGQAWTADQVAGSALFGVSATAAASAWTVGYANNSVLSTTSAKRWNGTRWTREASPSPGSSYSIFDGVAATPAGGAWAVGYANNSLLRDVPLAARWTGTQWVQVSSPDPGGSEQSTDLIGVAATPAGGAWAVGYYGDARNTQQTLTERWTGTSFARVASPDVGGATGNNTLHAVTAPTTGLAWAVGDHYAGSHSQTLILRWSGTRWTTARSPDPGGTGQDNLLVAVSGRSARSAWAVGYYQHAGHYRSLVLHWNGTGWKQVASPDPGTSTYLSGVATAPDGSAWIVGSYQTAHSPSLPLALRCTTQRCG